MLKPPNPEEMAPVAPKTTSLSLGLDTLFFLSLPPSLGCKSWRINACVVQWWGESTLKVKIPWSTHKHNGLVIFFASPSS